MHGVGEHNMWCKMSVFDVATRIPLLISVPWLSDTHGSTANGCTSHCIPPTVLCVHRVAAVFYGCV